jgi:cobalamin biosynthetic protein CobC
MGEGKDVSSDLLHGGNIAALAARFPNAPLPWIDLSTGINPWPYPLGIIPSDVLNRLPDSALQRACIDAMASAWGAPSTHILATPGSAIAITLLPYVLNAKDVSIVSPTYGDHAASWARHGANVHQVATPGEAHGDVIVVVNPNNPDARSWPQTTLMEVAHSQAARGGWLIIDEAYGEANPDLTCAQHGGTPGLIVLRSLGKFYGLAGVRLGAVLGPSPILPALSSLMGPWPVSGPALWAGTKALRDQKWANSNAQCLTQVSTQLCKLLEFSGLTIAGQEALFVYVKAGDAHALWHHLAAQGIATRRFDWTASHLRIGLPVDDDAIDRLTRALKSAPKDSISP